VIKNVLNEDWTEESPLNEVEWEEFEVGDEI